MEWAGYRALLVLLCDYVPNVRRFYVVYQRIRIDIG